MTSLKGDLRSIMGTPFGGVGHAVLIFSRVTRAAFNSDSVVLQLHDRIEMPEEADGKFQVDGLDPGPIRIELEGGTVHNHGWNIDLPDEGVWSLTDLVDAQVDWSPAVIGRAEAAAREAREHADRAEAGADRVGTAEQVGVWASEASSSASAAASARSAAQTARNASQSARDVAEGHANRAATSESNAKTSETNAKQSETNAGDYAAVATTAATEAVDAMESASGAADSIANSVSAAAGHADRASQSESGAAAYAQNASDAADRVGSAEQVGVWARQAQDASDRIGTAEQVGVWADESSAAASLASTSASKAKISETNAATHEVNSLSAAERAEFAAEETIQQVSGDFATRNYVDGKSWSKGNITYAHQTMADVGVGAWNIAGRDHAVRLGLPSDFGSLQVMLIGNSKTAFFIGQSTGMWINTSSGTTWGEWQRLSDSSDGNTSPSDGNTGGGTAGLKTVGMQITAGSVLNGVAGRYRVLAQVTAPVVRWRIHVESRRLLSTATTAFTLGNVYVGKHSGNGSMSEQQQIKSGSLPVAAGGEWVSPWLDASQLANETLVDLDVSGSSLFRSQATSWVYENGSWVSSKNSPVSIWAELETYDQVPVVGMIGDSTGAGQGAARPVFDSALYIAARKDKFIPMSYSYPGALMSTITDYGLHIFQRWAHLDKPDSVIIQAGSNDIHNGASISELQSRFVSLVETAEKISPVVIGATVKARYPNSGEYQTTLNAHNAFVKTRANGNRDYVDFYQALSPTGTVAAADAADAAHLTTSGHQKLATAFDSVTVSRPAWINTVAGSFAGTGSPERKVEAPVGSVYTDTAATNGAIRWIKTSGTGTTGWRVEYGDTGWRNLRSAISPAPTTGVFNVIRNTTSVTLHFDALPVDGTNTYTQFPFLLPAGFRPLTTVHMPASPVGSGDAVGPIRVQSNGTVTIYGASGKNQVIGLVAFPAEKTWPTSLPGTPL